MTREEGLAASEAPDPTCGEEEGADDGGRAAPALNILRTAWLARVGKGTGAELRVKALSTYVFDVYVPASPTPDYSHEQVEGLRGG